MTSVVEMGDPAVVADAAADGKPSVLIIGGLGMVIPAKATSCSIEHLQRR